MNQESKEKIKVWLAIIFFCIPVVGFTLVSVIWDLKGRMYDNIWLGIYAFVLAIVIDIWFRRRDYYGRRLLILYIILILYYLWSHYTHHSVFFPVGDLTHFIILILGSIFYLWVIYQFFKTLAKV